MSEGEWQVGPQEQDEELPDLVLPVAPAGSVPPRRPGGLRYWQMYSFVFTSPQWGMNMLAGIVCQLVPIVGSIVFVGYGYEVVEVLHRWGGRRYPDFDTSRLSSYLMRGLWVFLIGLIVMLPLMLLGAISAMVVAVLVAAAARGDDRTMGIVVASLVLAVVGLIFLLELLVVPLALRAGLSQELNLSGATSFVVGFLRRTWKELLLGILFLTITSPFLYAAGLLLCYVGLYPAVVWVIFAGQHLLYQLYQVYLGRGGPPIRLKPERRPRHLARWDDV